MMQTDDAIATRWAHAAARAPRIAVRRWITRAVLVLLTVPGAMQLSQLVLWSVRTGQAGLLAVIAIHVLALAIAMGLPARHEAPDEDTPSFLGALFGRYGDRAARLGALARAISIEALVLFAAPPFMTLVAGDRLRWPAYFVVAVAACTVVWPLERIAAAQRKEAVRLNALVR